MTWIQQFPPAKTGIFSTPLLAEGSCWLWSININNKKGLPRQSKKEKKEY